MSANPNYRKVFIEGDSYLQRLRMENIAQHDAIIQNKAKIAELQSNVTELLQAIQQATATMTRVYEENGKLKADCQVLETRNQMRELNMQRRIKALEHKIELMKREKEDDG